jgi:hypothetical protein
MGNMGEYGDGNMGTPYLLIQANTYGVPIFTRRFYSTA